MTKSPDRIGELRDSLVRRLEALEAANDAAAASRRPVELDQAAVGRLSRMDALQMQAMAQAAETQRIQERERIKATIGRIDAGDYGYCVACGEDIAPKRLAVDPTIATCIRCASRTA